MILMFLKLEGIKGTSTMANHVGELELLSYSWGGKQIEQMFTVGAESELGTDIRNDFSASKYADTVSQQLIEACINGKRFNEAVLTIERVSKNNSVQTVKKIILKDSSIVSYQSGGEMENFAMDFQSVVTN